MAEQPKWSLSEAGDDITLKCEVGGRSHQVVVNASSKPTHDTEKTYGQMSDAELIEAEKHSFAEFLAAASAP